MADPIPLRPDNRRGDRVRLIHSTDPYTHVPSGTSGTVAFVDMAGTVHVKWDDGHVLGLIPGVDRWVTLTRSEP